MRIDAEEYHHRFLICFGFLMSLVGDTCFSSFDLSPVRILIGWLNQMECHPQHPHDPKKFQTMLRVRVPKEHIIPEKIRQILSWPRNIRDAYALILNIPGAKIIEQKNPLWQTKQKVGNCWGDWVFAYLKNTLGKAKYNRLRALLFANCLKQLQKAPDSYPNKEKLRKELERKIKKRYPRYMSLTH